MPKPKQSILFEERTQIPTPDVANAAETLRQAASTAPSMPNGVLFRFNELKEMIKQAINGVDGPSKGPAQEARSIIDDYLPIAIKLDYNLNDYNVIKAFAYFLLAVVTRGFEGKETGGTTVGNYQGNWRGGAMFDYKDFKKQ